MGRLALGLYASLSSVERRLRGGRLRVEDFPRHDFVGLDGALAKQLENQWLVSKGATRFVFRSNSDFALQDRLRETRLVDCSNPSCAERASPFMTHEATTRKAN